MKMIIILQIAFASAGWGLPSDKLNKFPGLSDFLDGYVKEQTRR